MAKKESNPNSSSENSDDNKQDTSKAADAKPTVSKMPSMGEVSSMATKLFGDIKKSVTEIYGEYKDKRKDLNPPASKSDSNEKK